MPQDNRGYSTGPGSGVDINIGATPGMSANARAVLQQMMSRPSDNWGSAVSRLGAAFALGSAEKKARTAKQKKTAATMARRQSWAESLGGGMSARDLAIKDPAFLGDTEFQKRWAGTAPPPEVEHWDTVQNPYDRGGVGQQSSTTGLLKNYQGPVATPAERQRRIVEGADKRKYYADTQEPVLPNVQAPPPETPDTSVSMPDQLKMVRQLSDDWQKTVRPMQGLLAQSERMSIGLRMAQRGDLLAGSQAILISFNKLLDPTSVVRESEYARSATGQSAIETLKGMAQKLKAGGAGVVLDELETYKQFGEKVVQKALESTVGPERKRISRLVEFAGVDPELIFTGRFASDAGPQGTPQGLPPMAQGLPPMAQGDPMAPQGAPNQAPVAALAAALTGGGQPQAPAPAPAAQDLMAPQDSPMAQGGPQAPEQALAATLMGGGSPLAAGPPRAPQAPQLPPQAPQLPPQTPMPTAAPASPQAAARAMLNLPDRDFMARAVAITQEEMEAIPADILQALSARMNQVGGR